MGDNISLNMDANGWNSQQRVAGGVSYKDSLLSSSYLPQDMSVEATIKECISEDEEDEDEDEEDYPVIKLSVKENKRIRSL